MAEESTRTFERRACKGEVMVYNIGGGPGIRAELRDVANGGACLMVDQPLCRRQGLRLVFPRKDGPTGRTGRTIIGHVVHSRAESGRYMVGVAFGWHAAVRENPRPIYRKTVFGWFGLFGRKAKTPSAISVRPR
jgi:PilZ domain